MTTSNTVPKIGDIVKVLKLSDEFLDEVPSDDQLLFTSMIGQFFKVVEIDEHGLPCVVREWHDENGQPQAHMIALEHDEYKKI